jgi:hypothetical protein
MDISTGSVQIVLSGVVLIRTITYIALDLTNKRKPAYPE